MNYAEIERLAIALANAKDVEANAKEARIKAEEELAEAIGGKEIGSTTTKIGRFSITVKRGWNYRIDAPQAFAKEFPDFVKVKEDIKVYAKAYETERENNTPLFARMSEHVTATPAKVAVELKL